MREGREGDPDHRPNPIKATDGQDRDDDGSRPQVLFKGASVFDRSQVTPLDRVESVRLDPPCGPLTGESHAHLLAPLEAFTGSLGFTVSRPPPAGSASEVREVREVRPNLGDLVGPHEPSRFGFRHAELDC